MSGQGAGPEPIGGKGGGDPAMEDILASIRRILNEDEPAQAALPQPQPQPRPPEPEPEPLALTEDMMVSPPPAEPEPPPPVVAAAPPVQALPSSPVEEAPEPAPAPAPPVEARASPGQGADALLEPTVAAATAAAVGNLLRAVAQERSATVHRGGPTIEDVVREEIRPLLKEWLDRHLPPIVERLVRAEIERVISRALP